MGCFDSLKVKNEKNGVWQDEYYYLHLRPQKAQELFNEFQKDGYLNEEGISKILKKMEITVQEQHLKQILDHTDVNHDNKYDFNEFKQLFYAILNADPSESIINVLFFCYDKDESGSIDRKEFEEICKSFNISFTKEELDEIFKQESDQYEPYIYIDEFSEIIKKKLAQK